MAAFKLPQRRNSQPQQPVGIDWSNPITRGLFFAVSGENQHGARFEAPLIATPDGVAYKKEGVGSTGKIEDVPLVNPVTSDAWSLFAIGNNADPAQFSALGGFNNAAGDRGVHLMYALFGSLQFGVDARNYAVDVSSGVDFPDENGRVAVTISPATISQYISGALVASGSNSDPGASITASRIRLFVKSGDNDHAADQSRVTLLAGWTRELSAHEVKSLTDNPWQIFAPIYRVLPLSGGAAGTTTRPSAVTPGTWTDEAGGTLVVADINDASDATGARDPAGASYPVLAFTMDTPMAASVSQTCYFRGNDVAAGKQVRQVLFANDGTTVVATGAWKTMTGSLATYSDVLTPTATAYKGEIQTQAA